VTVGSNKVAAKAGDGPDLAVSEDGPGAPPAAARLPYDDLPYDAADAASARRSAVGTTIADAHMGSAPAQGGTQAAKPRATPSSPPQPSGRGIQLCGEPPCGASVDLASAARRGHILDGEVRSNGSFGGGHRPGTGYPGKSEFPSGWSDEQIMHHISDVATDPHSTVRPGRGGDVFVQGTRDGVDIQVLIRNGQIWTAYPTSTPRNAP